MMSTRELASLAKALGGVVREHVANAIGGLSAKLAELEQRVTQIPAGKDGAPGERGADGVNGKDGLPGADGRDGTSGKDGAPGERGVDGTNGKDGVPGERGVDGTNGKDGTPGERGVDGTHGKDGVPGDRGVDGINGKDGRDGIDGKSITLEDVSGFLESAVNKWALDFERRATDQLQRAVDRLEKPKDGRDAFQLEDVEVILGADDRTLTLAFVRDGARVERSVVLPVPIYRGVYKAGEKYQRGDTVSFGGSTFTAMRDTDSKPETDDSFRLSTKRGRDGKDFTR